MRPRLPLLASGLLSLAACVDPLPTGCDLPGALPRDDALLETCWTRTDFDISPDVAIHAGPHLVLGGAVHQVPESIDGDAATLVKGRAVVWLDASGQDVAQFVLPARVNARLQGWWDEATGALYVLDTARDDPVAAIYRFDAPGQRSEVYSYREDDAEGSTWRLLAGPHVLYTGRGRMRLFGADGTVESTYDSGAAVPPYAQWLDTHRVVVSSTTGLQVVTSTSIVPLQTDDPQRPAVGELVAKGEGWLLLSGQSWKRYDRDLHVVESGAFSDATLLNTDPPVYFGPLDGWVTFDPEGHPLRVALSDPRGPGMILRPEPIPSAAIGPPQYFQAPDGTVLVAVTTAPNCGCTATPRGLVLGTATSSGATASIDLGDVCYEEHVDGLVTLSGGTTLLRGGLVTADGGSAWLVEVAEGRAVRQSIPDLDLGWGFIDTKAGLLLLGVEGLYFMNDTCQ